MKLASLILSAAAGLALSTAMAAAETISVDGGIAVRDSSVERPNRGMSMSGVEARFGQPATRRNAVGQPPITRWDYPGFSVFFENQIVIHAVATG